MKTSMRSLVCFVVTLAVLSCYSTSTHAWGRSGHRIVAMIAERNVCSQTRPRINQILGKNVKLADVANYADDVGGQFPNTPNFHFVRIPIDDNLADDLYGAGRDCQSKPQGDCLLAAIQRYRDQILSPNSTPSQRSFALKFIIHLVGDMHQPLHCAERNKDGGGSAVSVTWFGHQSDLLQVWESRIIDRPHLTDEQFVQGLINGSTAEEMNEMRKGSILRWAMESHRLAGEFAYDLPADGKLGQAYYDKNWPIVDKQLLRGGMRLARVLDWLFLPHTESNSVDPLVLQP